MSRTVVLRVGPASGRTTTRALAVKAVLLVAIVACALVALMLGDHPLGVGQVLSAFAPGADDLDRMVVVEWRAPRVAAAVLLGACLGVSGAVFQSLIRNPLGSPDVVGLSTGAYTGVMTVLLLGGTSYAAQAGGALAGGLGTAALIYLLAFRNGTRGFRLVVVGIAVSAMLSSVNTWLTVKADVAVAMQAAAWGAGSLNGLGWTPVLVAAGAAALFALALPTAGHRLRHLELGDETAAALGVPVERSKVLLVVLGVAFTAIATAVAGPVAFVALAAPQVARRLTGTGGADLAGAACVGALLLSASDVVAQHAIPGASLPVGAVTVCVGGAYLVWLLFRETGRS